MARTIKTIFSFAALVLSTSAFTLVAGAHEHREVADSQYEFTVGFLEEPAYVDQMNGVSLRVVTVEDEVPVEGLAASLTAEVVYGDQSMELELVPVFDDPGHYQAIFFPTATGAYTFHITGEIEGDEIGEEFTSGPETFSEVEPIEPLQFPEPTD